MTISILKIRSGSIRGLTSTLGTLLLNARTVGNRKLKSGLSSNRAEIRQDVEVLRSGLRLTARILSLVLTRLNGVFTLRRRLANNQLNRARSNTTHHKLTTAELTGRAGNLTEVGLRQGIVCDESSALKRTLNRRTKLDKGLLERILSLRRQDTLINVYRCTSPPFLRSLHMQSISKTFLEGSKSPR